MKNMRRRALIAALVAGSMGGGALGATVINAASSSAVTTTTATSSNEAAANAHPGAPPYGAAPNGGKFVPNENPAHEKGESAQREAQEDAGQFPTVP